MAISAACTYSAIGCWLRIFRTNSYGRWLLFTVAGIVTTAVGLLLTYVEVSQFDANQYAVRPINWFPMTLLGFGINLLIFGDRQVSKKKSGKRWFVVAAFMTGFSFSLYATLTSRMDVHYLYAQVITSAAVGVVHFALTCWKVFAEESKKRAASG